MRIIKIKGYGNELGMKLEYPIVIDRSKQYEIALIGWFSVYHSLSLKKNYEIRIGSKIIIVPKGLYTVDSLGSKIQSLLQKQESGEKDCQAQNQLDN